MHQRSNNFDSTHTTAEAGVVVTSYVKTPFNEALFCTIAQKILGKKYALSLVLCDSRRAKAINMKHRGKTYVPNVLSFPLTDRSGELFLTLSVSDKEASEYGHSKENHRIFLLIHGLLHLCGHTHGSTMEREERRYFKFFTQSKK